jgi:hypothetical protein
VAQVLTVLKAIKEPREAEIKGPQVRQEHKEIKGPQDNKGRQVIKARQAFKEFKVIKALREPLGELLLNMYLIVQLLMQILVQES